MNIRFMQGNEAIAEAALASGLGFFSAYPITPSSEITEILSRKMPENGRVFIQAEDELASLGSVLGASIGGLKAMTATSGPGFSLMQEHIGYAGATETPCVVVNVMRVGPASGLATFPSQGDVMQSRWGCHGDHPIVVLCPSTVSECYELTIRAFNISEKLRVPVIILSDSVVAHVRERIDLDEFADLEIFERKMTDLDPDQYLPFQTDDSLVPDFAPRGEGYRYHICSNIHDETGFPTDSDLENAANLTRRLSAKLDLYQDEITFVDTNINANKIHTLVVSYGSVTRSVKDALLTLDDPGIGHLHLKTLWPFPSSVVARHASLADQILVPELNLGQLVKEVREVTHKQVTSQTMVGGDTLAPHDIIQQIKEMR
jgi:2-oxoglutarate ferredoxin oxidoreductase subunit alpha